MFNFRTKWSVPVFVIRLRPVQIIRESIWTGPRLGPVPVGADLGRSMPGRDVSGKPGYPGKILRLSFTRNNALINE